MATNSIPKDAARQFFLAVETALREGAYPYNHPDINGRDKRSAVRVAMMRLGMKPGSANTHLEACRRALDGAEPDWNLWSGSRPRFDIAELPSYQPSIEEILEKRTQEWQRRSKAREARRLIEVKINTSEPIGILHFGDPHLDDPGTDIPLVKRHMELINGTPGLFGACVGDFINNWRGKLAHLHGSQTTTQMEALKLLEWFVSGVRWLYLIGGNHDVWHGEGDPLIWFRRGIGSIYEWHGCRLSLKFPNKAECRIHARHTFPGSSMYNPAHGATKAAKFAGEDHIYISGHIHDHAYIRQENPAKDLVWHAIQLAAYKKIDDYADRKALDAKRYGEAALTVIDPKAENAMRLVSVFGDIEFGVDFLTFLRKKRAA